MMETITVRKLDLQDTRSLVELSRDAGWNQQEAEIRDIIARSGENILGAFHGEELAGVAAAYCYVAVAFINEVIVNSVWRKQGIATRLLNELLPKVLPQCPTLRLYATGQGRPIYEKLGFVPYGTLCFCQFKNDLSKPSQRVRPVLEEDIPQMCALDEEQFGLRREALIRKLFCNAPESAWCIRENGCLQGFILRSLGEWLLQSRSVEGIAELLLHANYCANDSLVVCLWKDDADALAAFVENHLELTAMQFGKTLSFPPKCHSGCLPDIG
ncbi:MAG: GNAT family N-acetyltransferase [Victivallales bacterium]|nr:GNAT family N-acetyltransferase [Victivallales bacterium]